MSSKKYHKKESAYKVNGAKVKDYSKEPYFVHKTESAKKVIEKYGLPKELRTGKK